MYFYFPRMFSHVASKNSNKDVSFLDKGEFCECCLQNAASSQTEAGRTGSVPVPVFLTWQCLCNAILWSCVTLTQGKWVTSSVGLLSDFPLPQRETGIFNKPQSSKAFSRRVNNSWLHNNPKILTGSLWGRQFNILDHTCYLFSYSTIFLLLTS